MSGRTVTRADLYRAVQMRIGLSHAASAGLVEDAIGEIVEALVRGEEVKISGFGVFTLRDRAPRSGRNPTTGEAVPIAARRAAVLRPSEKLKARINGARERPRSGKRGGPGG